MTPAQIVAMSAADLPRHYLCLPQAEHGLVWLLALCALFATLSAVFALVGFTRVLRRYSILRRELLSQHPSVRAALEDEVHPMYRDY